MVYAYEQVRQLMALAFVPILLVRNTFAQLRAASDPSLVQLFDYFEEQWLTRTPVPMWNVYRTEMKTNNALEGWHARFNSIVSKHHPNLWHLVESLRAEQDATEVTINQVLAGNVVNRRNRRFEQVEARIKRITRRYDSGQSDVMEYIIGISHNLA
jgi:hypothetical protein